MNKPNAEIVSLDESARITKAVIRVTVFGETHDVNAMDFGGKFITDYDFSARCGRTGQKTWPASLTIWKNADGSLKVDIGFAQLNRNTGRVIGWASRYPWNTEKHAESWVERYGEPANA